MLPRCLVVSVSECDQPEIVFGESPHFREPIRNQLEIVARLFVSAEFELAYRDVVVHGRTIAARGPLGLEVAQG